MKANDHPNPADIMYEKIMGYVYDPEESDDIIIVLENYIIEIPFESLIIRKRDEKI